jgi:hypothetical protein
MDRPTRTQQLRLLKHINEVGWPIAKDGLVMQDHDGRWNPDREG